MESVAATNREATEAWSGPLFDRFVRYRELVAGGPRRPRRGGDGGASAARRATGCWTSAAASATRRSGSPSWSAPRARRVGVDVSEPFIEQARGEAEGRVGNVRFAAVDVQVAELERGLRLRLLADGDHVLRQPGAGAAQRARGAAPGGRFCAVVWRRKDDNEWVHRAELVVEEYLDHPEETDEPTCGPGPVLDGRTPTRSASSSRSPASRRSPCGAATCRSRSARTSTTRSSSTWRWARPARCCGSGETGSRRSGPKIAAELREALAEFDGPDGVIAPASTWIVAAKAPASEAVQRRPLTCRMAEAASTESVPARLAEIREQLKLLSDYL